MTNHDMLIAKIAKNSVYGSFRSLAKRSSESDEEFVIRMLKGDFEKIAGVSFDKFYEIRDCIVKQQEMLV